MDTVVWGQAAEQLLPPSALSRSSRALCDLALALRDDARVDELLTGVDAAAARATAASHVGVYDSRVYSIEDSARLVFQSGLRIGLSRLERYDDGACSGEPAGDRALEYTLQLSTVLYRVLET